ncbi:MAG: hypothetical protein LBH74_00545, partial [Nitrososphaerota archaeon]|nr:hypothetical protein [Nitrososphaerota archaeon]
SNCLQKLSMFHSPPKLTSASLDKKLSHSTSMKAQLYEICFLLCLRSAECFCLFRTGLMHLLGFYWNLFCWQDSACPEATKEAKH